MKDIVSKINESKWLYSKNIDLPYTNDDITFNVPNDAKWLFINTESEIISPINVKQLEKFEASDLVKAVKALKVGESFDADGGISIYIRIKK